MRVLLEGFRSLRSRANVDEWMHSPDAADGFPVSADGISSGIRSCAGAEAYPWLPVRLGMLDRFESAARARRMAERGTAGVPSHGANAFGEVSSADRGGAATAWGRFIHSSAFALV